MTEPDDDDVDLISRTRTAPTHSSQQGTLNRHNSRQQPEPNS